MKHHKKIRYRFLAFTVCRTRAPTIVALCLLVLFIGACQNATPVAPNATPLGGGYVLTQKWLRKSEQVGISGIAA